MAERVKIRSLSDLTQETPRKTFEKAKSMYEDFKEMTLDSKNENYLYKIFMLKRLMDSIEDLCYSQAQNLEVQ